MVDYLHTTSYYVRAEEEKAKAAEVKAKAAETMAKEKVKADADATARADAMMVQLILEEEGAQGMVTITHAQPGKQGLMAQEQAEASRRPPTQAQP